MVQFLEVAGVLSGRCKRFCKIRCGGKVISTCGMPTDRQVSGLLGMADHSFMPLGDAGIVVGLAPACTCVRVEPCSSGSVNQLACTLRMLER